MSIFQEQRLFFSLKSAVALFLMFTGICLCQSTWVKEAPLPLGNNLNSVTYGNGMYVAVDDSGTILTSPNGTTWTIKKSGTTGALNSVTYGDGQFIAVGYGLILTSYNGTIWTKKYSDTNYLTSYSLNSVTYGNGQFIAVGRGLILTSPNGTTWTKKYSDTNYLTSYYLASVTYGDSQFVAVGSGTIITSPDGSIWASKNADIRDFIGSVTYGNGRFVAINYNEYMAGSVGFYSISIFTSLDASTWTKKDSVLYFSVEELFGPSSSGISVTYGNNQFVAVCGYTILTSQDGATWTIKYSNTNYLTSVTYGNGRFVAVGYYGTILTSKADIPTGVAFQPSAKPNISGLKINTTNNCISATLPYATSRSQLKVELFTVSGRRIYSATARAQKGILNIPAKGFPTGKYFMSIKDENNKTMTSSFVLTR